MRAYLDAFADAFDLKRLVRFHTRVLEAEPVATDVSLPEETSESSDAHPARHQWRLTSEPLPPATDASPAASADGASGGSTTELFDGLVVCNGHYSEPRLPPAKGDCTCS